MGSTVRVAHGFGGFELLNLRLHFCNVLIRASSVGLAHCFGEQGVLALGITQVILRWLNLVASSSLTFLLAGGDIKLVRDWKLLLIVEVFHGFGSKSHSLASLTSNELIELQLLII